MTEPTPETLRMAKGLAYAIEAKMYVVDSDCREEPEACIDHAILKSTIAQALTEAVQGARETALGEFWSVIAKSFEGITANYGSAYEHGQYDLANKTLEKLRSLKTQPPASQGTGGLVEELVEALKKARDNINLANGDSRPGQKAWSGDFLINEIDAALARAKAREAGKEGK